MSSRDRGSGLHDRRSEREVLDRLVARAQAGQSQTLVLRGEAGVGKTALLDELARRVSGCRIVRASGAESEMELAFAGLHQLCAPILDRVDGLPGPQRDALATAFGLRPGNPPDRFLVGLAVLSLLSDVAESQSLLCLIDDAQWLDRVSSQTLAFAARRLFAERVAMVFAVRDSSGNHDLAPLPQLLVDALPDGDARALLDSAIAGRMDERVRDRIVAETRGNPLALLELWRGLTAEQLAGGFALPDAQPLTSRIEQSFLRRLESLPTQTQQLLLTAAAEPLGDVALLWRAARRLGIDPPAATPAEAAGLIELGARVQFRHPLVRSAAYRTASPEKRRNAHRALADATDPDTDPDRRAWHLAQATSNPDENVASELERSAGRAEARGGLAAAAAFLERATQLTPSPAQRVQRALTAAHAKLQVGAFDSAIALLGDAEHGPLSDLQRARIDLLRAELAFASKRGNEAPPLLLAAARRLEPLDIDLARGTYLDALSAAMFAGRLAGRTGVVEVAQAARQTPSPREPGLGDLFLEALSTRFTDGYPAAVPLSQQALRAFCGSEVSAEDVLRWSWLAGAIAADLWDDHNWHIAATRYVHVARAAGALSQLPLALNSRIVIELFAGQLPTAAALIGEASSVVEMIGIDLVPYGAVWLAAWRGHEEEADQLGRLTLTEATARGEGIGLTVTQAARAMLANALGDYKRAVVEARHADESPLELAAPSWGLTELIEAAARLGDSALARDAFARLCEMTSASRTEWALGIEARSRAQLRDDDAAAEPLYREAIDRLSHTRVRVELARARLLYGEWLRRQNRRVDAREQLRIAHDTFTAMGTEAFAGRAGRELQATGERLRKRTAETTVELTAQEAQIARLVGDGLTNPEVGAQLFLSPRTVEWHLHNVFTKLGVSSRRQLAGR